MKQMEGATPVLAIDDLTLALPRLSDRRNAVQNLSLTVATGETLCVVGESGSGKSLTAYAVMGLLPPAFGRFQVPSGSPAPNCWAETKPASAACVGATPAWCSRSR